jgi:hypothetical protein
MRGCVELDGEIKKLIFHKLSFYVVLHHHEIHYIYILHLNCIIVIQ